MKVREVYKILDSISPFSLQEEWDNSGLNIGDFEADVENIYVALDIDDSVIDKVKENSLIITHHPLIFKGLKKVTPTNFAGKYVIELIKKNVSLIAMHTNFDKTHLNRYFAENVLGLKGVSEDFIYYVDIDMTFDELVAYVKDKMKMEYIKVVKANDKIKRVAITTGAGMSLLNYINADCFLTGDIKYHEAMDAKARNISLIDIEHYKSERYFVDVFRKVVDLNVDVLEIKDPFKIY